MDGRFVLKLVTLNGVVAAILRYFTKFGRFGANYAIMVEIKLIVWVRNVA